MRPQKLWVNWVDEEGLAKSLPQAAIKQAVARGDVAELEAILDATGDSVAKIAIEILKSKAKDIIVKEYNGSVNREFLKEMYEKTIEEITKLACCGDKTARKAKNIK